jgi:excisionase family DNA binding protein
MGTGSSAVAQRPVNAARGPLLKTEEAARYLAVSPRQVQYLSQRGELPCVRIGNSTRYTKGDLDDFVDRCRQRGGRG